MSIQKDFKYSLSRIAGAENLMSCYGCGTCTAGCPVRALDERYNPRKIVRMALLGKRDELLEGSEIWLCTSCYTCQERCPQDVKITDLIVALRNLAVSEGHCPQGIGMQSEFVYEFGRLYELSDFDNKKRGKLGLPTVKIKFEEVDKVFPVTKKGTHKGSEE